MADDAKNPTSLTSATSQQGAHDDPDTSQASRRQVDRRTTAEIVDEGKDLREAAEQTLNVIIDIDLDSRVRWVSPSWQEVVGTLPESLQGKPIADIILDDDKNIFVDALEDMRKDDSGSKIIHFSVQMGETSVLSSPKEAKAQEDEDAADNESDHDHPSSLALEAQGILVYDRSTGNESHTMWMVRPAITREVTIDLPKLLVESLGDGAEMLAHHLTQVAKHGNTDPEHNPPPLPVLCRICERQITPWWFPKHTDLCLQEHQAEADLQMAQENLTEHRYTIVKILDALEARSRWKTAPPTDNSTPPPPAEYKSFHIGAEPSAHSSRGVSPGSSPSRSRDRSSSGVTHTRPRSFTVRRPLSTKVELVLDLCDTAMEISQPTLKERLGAPDDGEIRTQSPLSENRVSQVLQWQSPVVEGEAGFTALCEDTANLAKAKVDAVLLSSRIIEYSERIRAEYASLVQECIDAALQKTARIAAGEISGDSSDESSGKEDEPEMERQEEVELGGEDIEQSIAEPTFDTTEIHHSTVTTDDESLAMDETSELRDIPMEDTAKLETSSYNAGQAQYPKRMPSHSHDRPSAMSVALRSAGSRSRSPSVSPNRQVSSTLSTRSSSPRSCPTPKSQGTTAPAAAPQNISRVPTNDFDVEGESDVSARSSFRSHSRSGRLSSNEFGLSRVASTRESKRTSLILPRERSMTRQESPNRNSNGMPPPSSPLRINKPRLPSSAVENARSPVISPTLGSLEFHSPTLGPMETQHRRQSSAASSDISRAAVSPRLSFVNNPQPRAVPPSIRDFEIIKPISKGAFGSVYLARKKSTGDYFAIKALKKQDMVAKNQVANVKAERAIMMFQGESEFVAKLYWTFPSKDYIFLVMEYLNGGDCASLVQSLGALPEDWAKKYIAEVVLGVEHLHSREIVHRDLKPDNLLIDQRGHLKLTDFGLSRIGLIGRQKRALSIRNSGAAPDPLKQGSFHRSVSMASSSRSASVDTHGTNYSPNQTPNLAPAFPADGSQPSYFSLGRESVSSSREGTRQSSMHQSDNGDTDQLQAAFRRFSIYDDPWGLNRSSPRDEENKELNEAVEGLSLHDSGSNPNVVKVDSAQNAATTGPPAMALFDPEDSNRRFVGTPDYLAPETINGLGQDEMSDWWSLGCILFEFLFGYPPFHAKSPDQVFDNILNRRIDWPPEEYDNDVSSEAKDLMNRLMCLDPSERLGANVGEKYSTGAEEIRKHPWFADIDWETLKDSEASFVPAPENIEDTEYFDARGATTQDFVAEFDDQSTSPAHTPVGEYERPHDALSKVRTHVNSMKRGLMPLHIPPHVRDGRNRRLSEPVPSDDFGQFSFKNLSVLEKANKDVIQKLRAEAMQAQSRTAQGSNQPTGNNSPPSLESSPVIGAPLKRALSTNRGNQRSASPSTLSHSNSSPSRASQPSSPLVQFSTGALHERRKTSGGNSSAPQGLPSLPAPGLFEIPKLPPSMKPDSSSASSPVKSTKPASLQPDSIPSHIGNTSPRARSHTIGSNESEISKDRISHHHKRRSQVIDISPSSSDTEDPRAKALLRVQRRRQSSRRLSQISIGEGPMFRPLDILVVEDHPVSRLVMEKILEKLRCRTIVVNDGAEAVRYAMTSVKFDIIMMEFKLPRINGADVARMVRETKNANCQTPIVAVTGYLKELTAPHHFDALVEKPPTPAKLTEVMSRLCQWRAPTPGPLPSQFPSQQHTQNQQASMPPSGLRKGSLAMDESPTSTTSSGYPSLPSLSQHGSSREDSLSTVSAWTESEVTGEEGQLKQGLSDWQLNSEYSVGGLGISESPQFGATLYEPTSNPQVPTLVTQESAPASLAAESEVKTVRKKPSTEQIEAKRKSLSKKHTLNTGESGDDEDDELGGPLNIRARSAKSRSRQGHHRAASKLSTEMMRSNSQGTVTESTPDTPIHDLETHGEVSEEAVTPQQPGEMPPPPPPKQRPLVRSFEDVKQSVGSEEDIASTGELLAPPEVFPQAPGGDMKEINMDAIMESRSEVESDDQTKTPQPEVAEVLEDRLPAPNSTESQSERA